MNCKWVDVPCHWSCPIGNHTLLVCCRALCFILSRITCRTTCLRWSSCFVCEQKANMCPHSHLCYTYACYAKSYLLLILTTTFVLLLQMRMQWKREYFLSYTALTKGQSGLQKRHSTHILRMPWAPDSVLCVFVLLFCFMMFWFYLVCWAVMLFCVILFFVGFCVV